jgi:hypothetical protein
MINAETRDELNAGRLAGAVKKIRSAANAFDRLAKDTDFPESSQNHAAFVLLTRLALALEIGECYKTAGVAEEFDKAMEQI